MELELGKSQEKEASVKPSRVINQVLNGVSRLGREVKISPKALACHNKAGYSDYYAEDTVVVNIGIGRDHVASLVMTKSAWEALGNGEEINTTFHNDFIKK